MFSNDRNISLLERLALLLKRHITLQGEYLRLEAAEKLVRLVVAVGILLVAGLLLTIGLVFLSLALEKALESIVAPYVACLITAGAYVVLFLVFLALRKPLLEKPLAKFFSALLAA